MKKYIYLFLLIILGSVLYYIIPYWLQNNNDVNVDKSKFVSIQNKQFNLNHRPFYPITLNYIVDLQTDGTDLWPVPSLAYSPTGKLRFSTKDSSLMQLKAEMDLIKEMGFNAVRVVGIGEEGIADEQSGRLTIRAKIGDQKDTSMVLWSDVSYEKYYSSINLLLDAVREAGLKVILLVRMSVDSRSPEIHLQKIARHFRNDTSILAFDLFNEPLYFDGTERDKKTVYNTVKRWVSASKRASPYHLTTIGLTGIREVFEWDPAILDVDFISIHPYEYEPEQVRNEMYWYSKYIKKPWIIGETAIPADNDSVSYSIQTQFAHNTLKQAFNCGAIGYSWWQFKDVEWHAFHANFMGVINWKGETKTQKENISVLGSVKPLVEEFKKFNPVAPKDNCICFSNYYNYSEHKLCKIFGTLIDESDKPIEGGVILAWNQYWSHSYHTVTKPDGSFELKGDFPFYHWMASASTYSMIRGDAELQNVQLNDDKTITINLGNLKVKKLSFID